jgi:hypothetical protein
MFLAWYFGYTNTIDPYMIIIISFIFWLYYQLFPSNVFRLSVFESHL